MVLGKLLEHLGRLFDALLFYDKAIKLSNYQIIKLSNYHATFNKKSSYNLKNFRNSFIKIREIS